MKFFHASVKHNCSYFFGLLASHRRFAEINHGRVPKSQEKSRKEINNIMTDYREYHVALTDVTTNAFLGNYTISTFTNEGAIEGAIIEAGQAQSGHSFSAKIYYDLPNGLHSPVQTVTKNTLTPIP